MVGVARAAPARIASRTAEHARLMVLIRFIAGVLLGVWGQELADLDAQGAAGTRCGISGAIDACGLPGGTGRRPLGRQDPTAPCKRLHTNAYPVKNGFREPAPRTASAPRDLADSAPPL